MWATETVSPASFFVVAVPANGRSSCIGSASSRCGASRSGRDRSSESRQMPVPPTPVVTSKLNAFTRAPASPPCAVRETRVPILAQVDVELMSG